MLKLFVISGSLCLTSFVSLSAGAVEPYQHYRTLHVKAELTKQTKGFQVKHLFPFHFPKNLPGVPVYIGAKGQLSTTTQAKLDKDGKDITYSETLFGIEYSANKCPKEGEPVGSYQEYFGKYHTHGFTGGIVKQTKGNSTQVANIDIMLPYGVPFQINPTGCGIVIFDGSDFNEKPYTMKVDLELKYTFQPVSYSLGAEYIVDADNQTQPRLNAYHVIPVQSKLGPRGDHRVMMPGTIYTVNGNISTSGVYRKNKGHWFVRYITAVYKNNSCQVAFKNHAKLDFSWNDKTGTSNTPNPSSVFWPDVTIISDFTVSGKDRDTVISEVKANNKLPIHVEDGDCVVQAALPYGDETTGKGTNLNTEFFVHLQTIPD